MSLLKQALFLPQQKRKETGSDTILQKINKGITAEQIVKSDLAAKKAGMALSEFTLRGIGSVEIVKALTSLSML